MKTWSQVEKFTNSEFYVSWCEWTGKKVLRDNNRGIITHNPTIAFNLVNGV